MAAIPAELRDFKVGLADGVGQNQLTTRLLLKWFNAERRSAWTNRYIRAALADLSLEVSPDFETANIDEHLAAKIRAPEKVSKSQKAVKSSVVETLAELNATGPIVSATALSTHDPDEPTLRVRILASAIRPPFTLEPAASIEEATTVMLSKEYSQIPVLRHRTVVGVISWKSLGSRLALGSFPKNVSDCLEEPLELRSETSLLDAIDQIVRRDYALIKDAKANLCGIVTTADLSAEFRVLSEPFLLLREVENFVRQLLSSRFSIDDLREFRDPNIKRSIDNVSDLTFGEYVHALTQEKHWSQLGLKLDQKQFISCLEHARGVRNDVMHFDPDPIEPMRILRLREFVRLLQSLAQCEVIGPRK